MLGPFMWCPFAVQMLIVSFFHFLHSNFLRRTDCRNVEVGELGAKIWAGHVSMLQKMAHLFKNKIGLQHMAVSVGFVLIR